jgi:amino acid transporter
VSILSRIGRAVLGPPKDVKDPHAFHKVSLIAVLAWVGLGADGLSSSAYGPEETFRALGEHTGLAVFLAAATALTVLVISSGYSRIIEQFPSGGGGYVVSSKILGPSIGVVSGSALLVDYVLTIAISIAAGADAIFSFLPHAWLPMRLEFAFAGLLMLTLLNLRGVKESVVTIAPVFFLFLVTHAILLVVALGSHATELPRVSHEIRTNVRESFGALGVAGALALMMRAYSMGGGTYTGIEAVSNGVGMMREPKVATAKRTMVLMAVSLALTAGGLVIAYLLTGAHPVEGRTMNAVFADRVAGDWSIGRFHFGRGFVIASLVSEGALLLVAAQAGFVDGPRVMANMATDSWLPHRFAALSEHLTIRNGVILMSGAAAAALLYTAGHVSRLVVMYSINVFVTFSLSNGAMAIFWVRERADHPEWLRRLSVHLLATLLCTVILCVTIYEKFGEGGWLTLVVTAAVSAFCFVVKRHYIGVQRAVARIDTEVPGPDPAEGDDSVYGRLPEKPAQGEPDPTTSVAILFVGGYGGLGRHALVTLLRMFPGHFKGVVFVSVGVVDSDVFKGAKEVDALERRTKESLESYVELGRKLGLPSTSDYAVGTEVAVEAEKIAKVLIERFPKALVVAGQMLFEEDSSWNRLLHNETAFLIMRRLEYAGIPMIVVPVQLDLGAARRGAPVLRGKWQAAPPSLTHGAFAYTRPPEPNPGTED